MLPNVQPTMAPPISGARTSEDSPACKVNMVPA
jgi:hypothetical protein